MVQSVCSMQLLQQAILGIHHHHPVHYSPRPIHRTGLVGEVSCPRWIQGFRGTAHPYQSSPHALHLHHTSKDQRSQVLLFSPPPPSLLTRKITGFYSHFSTKLKTQALSKSLSLKWSKFISLQRNWEHLNLFHPLYSLGYSNISPHFGFSKPRTINRYDLKT